MAVGSVALRVEPPRPDTVTPVDQQTDPPFDASVTFTIDQDGLVLIHVKAESYDPRQAPPTWALTVAS